MTSDDFAAEVVSSGPEAAARRVLEHVGRRRATLGSGRLVCIDGPAGSGKSTLAARLHDLAPRASLVHMDDLYEGWDGLATVGRQLPGLVGPLARGDTGSFLRWDWHAGAWAERVEVSPADLLLLEGVGSGSLEVAELVTLLVWVEAPHDLRMRRGIERDGEAFARRWHDWADAETAHFAAQGTRERADVVVHTEER